MLASILKKKKNHVFKKQKSLFKTIGRFSDPHTPWPHMTVRTCAHHVYAHTHPTFGVITHTHLCLLQTAFGNSTVGFRMFDSTGYGGTDLLFSDATHHLQRVLGSYTSWLGSTYTTMLQAFECEGELVCVCVKCVYLLCVCFRVCVHCSCSHYCSFPPPGFC